MTIPPSCLPSWAPPSLAPLFWVLTSSPTSFGTRYIFLFILLSIRHFRLLLRCLFFGVCSRFGLCWLRVWCLCCLLVSHPLSYIILSLVWFNTQISVLLYHPQVNFLLLLHVYYPSPWIHQRLVHIQL